MSHRWAQFSVLAIVVLALLPMAAQADYPYDITKSNGLLATQFGVNLTLDPHYVNCNLYGYKFNLDSLNPTKNTDTVDFYVEDWFGKWDYTGYNYNAHCDYRAGSDVDFVAYNTSTYPGAWPYGNEIYDAEAIYFDDDETNLYIAVVTSYDPPPGRRENFWGWGNPQDPNTGIQGFTGDLALEVPDNANGTFDYLFGVNWNNEQRQSDGTALKGTPVWDDGLYQTSNAYWYNPKSGGNVSGAKASNFDQDYAVNGGTPSYIKDATVSFYKWFFYSGDNEIKENHWDTWVYEATIPKSALADYVPMSDGTGLRIHWGMSCGNDYGEKLTDFDVEIGQPPVTPEASTLVLLCASLAVGGLFRRRSSKTPSGDA